MLLIILFLPHNCLPYTIDKFVVDLLDSVDIFDLVGKFGHICLLKVPFLVGFFDCRNQVLLFR